MGLGIGRFLKRTGGVLGSVLTVVGSVVMYVNPALGVALMVAGTGLSYYSARGQAKEAMREADRRRRAALANEAIKANVFSSTRVHYLVFGEMRVGGLVVVHDTADADTKKNYKGIAHSVCHAGGCEGITDIWIDDVKVLPGQLNGDPHSSYAEVDVARYRHTPSSTYMVKLRHFRGLGTQAADAQLVTDGVGLATDYRRGMAWTSFLLTRPPAAGEEQFREAFPRSEPTLGVTLRGIKCYDPRLDDTNGGAGTHRYNDVLTWEWTRNPPLIAGTYMIMSKDDGGMGRDPALIAWDVLAESADICDQVVSTPDGDRPRYSCDIALDAEDMHEVNLRRILDCMWGEYANPGGRPHIFAAAYVAPSVTIDETWLRGGVTVQRGSGLDGVYNSVRVLFNDKDKNYTEDEAPAFSDAAYISQDGGETLWREESLSGVTDTWQAQRIATIIGKLSRAKNVIQVACNWKALTVQCWDTATVVLAEPGINGVFRIVDWGWDGMGPVLALREESADFYDGVSYSAPVALGDIDTTDETPDPPANLAASANIDGITLTWDSPLPADVVRVDVHRATDVGGPYTLVGSTGRDYRFHDPIAAGGTYYYKVKARTGFAIESAFSAVVSATIAGPDDVTNLKLANQVGATFVGRDAEFEWDNGQPPVHSERFRDYRVRIIRPSDAAVVRTEYTTAPRYRYTYEMNAQDEGGTPLRTFQIEVLQVMRDGAVSGTAATLTVTNDAPAAPNPVTLTATLAGLDVAFPNSADPDAQLCNVYVSTSNGFTPGAGNRKYQGAYQNPVKITGLTPSTTHYVKVAIADVFGEGAFSTQAGAAPSGAVGSPQAFAPGAPSGLALATAVISTALVQGGQIRATWNAATNGSDGAPFYEVEYWTTDSSKRTTVRTNDTSYNIFPAEFGTQYSVRVRASGYTGLPSAYTGTLTATITSSSAVITTAPSGGRVSLDNVNGLRVFNSQEVQVSNLATDGSGTLGQGSGTYSRTGTTITVSITSHGYAVGDGVALLFTSGSAISGGYIVVTAAAHTFTVTSTVSGSTSGNVNVLGIAWSAAGKITMQAARILGTLTANTLRTAASGKRFEVDSVNNEGRFYGDRGDAVVELLASLGINTDGSDTVIGLFGTANSTRAAIVARGKGSLVQRITSDLAAGKGLVVDRSVAGAAGAHDISCEGGTDVLPIAWTNYGVISNNPTFDPNGFGFISSLPTEGDVQLWFNKSASVASWERIPYVKNVEELISVTTLGGASSQVQLVFPAGGTYRSFRVVISNLRMTTDNTSVAMRINSGGSLQQDATDYSWSAIYNVHDGISQSGANSDSEIQLCANQGIDTTAADPTFGAVIEVLKPYGTDNFKTFLYRSAFQRNTGQDWLNVTGSGQYKGGTAALESISFIPSSSTIAADAVFELWGIP